MKLDLKNKKVLVMGLGVHGGGLGVTKWLISRGAQVTVTDLKTKKQLTSSLKELKGSSVRFVLGRHDEKDFKNSDLIVKNPGVPNESPYLKIAKKYKVPVEEAIALFVLECAAPIIGITGTKGKSTTTTLLGEIFKATKKKPIVAGNIRVSPFRFLKQIESQTKVVLELSSWQLEGLEKHHLSPHISILTNIYPDHLNRYRSFKHYIETKFLIFKHQTKDDFAILNKDNQASGELGKKIKSQRFWFSKKYFSEENGCYIKDGWIYFRKNGVEGKIIKKSEVIIPGEHNLENILAATAAAMISGVKVEFIKKVIKKFAGIEDRLELVVQKNGVKYYNDTAATAPDAAILALKTLGRNKNIILIAGGTDKKLIFSGLAKEIKKQAKELILFPGTATLKIKQELRKVKYNKFREAKNMAVAVGLASKMAKTGEIVLLSPGCASFGLFQNEFDRGEQFKKALKNL